MSMMFETPKLRPVSIFHQPVIFDKPFTNIDNHIYICYRSHQFQHLLEQLPTYNHVLHQRQTQHHNSDHSSIGMSIPNPRNAWREFCRLGRNLCSQGRFCFQMFPGGEAS